MTARFVVEHGEGDLSHIHPVPVTTFVDPHLTLGETMHCAWLQWCADCARSEVRKALEHGVDGFAAIDEYMRQADDYETRIAEIEAAAFCRHPKRTSVAKQLMVAVAIVMGIAAIVNWPY